MSTCLFSYNYKVMKFLRQVGDFLWILQFPPPIKLKVTLNTIALST